MADIELVIKIPEERLNSIKNRLRWGIFDSDLFRMIANGIPLDKILDDSRVDCIDKWDICGKEAEVWLVKGKLQIRHRGVIHNIERVMPIIQADKESEQ